jgi:NAD(P)-dependent dehydrogenase (short-subunit alcohol dehydrogenase family)
MRCVLQLSPESAGEAPGRGRLQGRKILVVGGGQRTFDAATDPVGNGRAMSLLFAREGAQVAVADMNRASADDTVQRIMAEGGRAFSIEANIAREDDVNRMIDDAVEGSAASTAWCSMSVSGSARLASTAWTSRSGTTRSRST